MIHATCHTADNVRCIEFDATTWFSEADASSIIDLAQRGGPAQIADPSSADEDTNACDLVIWRSDCSPSLRLTLKPSVRRRWTEAVVCLEKTGLTL
jgi:hypothetical protein